jgi:Uncharacterized protein conserved in bacteria (DUF2188)
LPVTEGEPIRVSFKDGGWEVEYGTSVACFHATRAEAVAAARAAAERENRELTIEQKVLTGDHVRLLVREHGVPEGTLGMVTGFYRRPTGEVAIVTFEDDSLVVPVESLEVLAPPEPDKPPAPG